MERQPHAGTPGATFTYPDQPHRGGQTRTNTAECRCHRQRGIHRHGDRLEDGHGHRVKPTVTLTKAVDKTTLPEPGGAFNYTLTVTNTSIEPVSFNLTDTQAGPWSGDLTAAGTPARRHVTYAIGEPRWAAGPTAPR